MMIHNGCNGEKLKACYNYWGVLWKFIFIGSYLGHNVLKPNFREKKIRSIVQHVTSRLLYPSTGH